MERSMNESPAFSTSQNSFSVPSTCGLERQSVDAMSDPSTQPGLPVAAARRTAATPLQSDDCVTDNSQSLLEACLKKAREWEKYSHLNEKDGMEAILLRMLVENVIRLGNPSIIAMCNVRKLLCRNCLQFKATQGQCEGKVLQPLDRCQLLKGQNT